MSSGERPIGAQLNTEAVCHPPYPREITGVYGGNSGDVERVCTAGCGVPQRIAQTPSAGPPLTPAALPIAGRPTKTTRIAHHRKPVSACLRVRGRMSLAVRARAYIGREGAARPVVTCTRARLRGYARRAASGHRGPGGVQVLEN